MLELLKKKKPKAYAHSVPHTYEINMYITHTPNEKKNRKKRKNAKTKQQSRGQVENKKQYKLHASSID